jgi:hypothetical protein
MKRCIVPLPICVAPPSRIERFLRSRACAFYAGFCTAALCAGVLSGALHFPN